MSVNVELSELRDKVGGIGSTPFLITVRDSGPHLVSVNAAWDGDVLVMPVGATTAGNATDRPEVSLLWPSTDGAYALIVDGRAIVERADDAAMVRLQPERAVLHRLASAGGDGPSCITVLDRKP